MKNEMTDRKESVHKSVLLKETIDGLNLRDGATVLDATFGGGGHSLEICKRYRNVKIIALDQDTGALKRAREKFEELNAEIILVSANFRQVANLKNGGGVDAIIFDLGLSSDQLETSGRGFTFTKDEPLLMTMKEDLVDEDLTAEEIINTWEEKNLADIIFGYGEEKFARRIAKGIVEARKRKEIKTTFELVAIIENSVPGSYKRGKIHFATRTFQALRIAVNDELGALKEGLAGGLEILKSDGRMGVISFHSLEDRIVKRFFKEKKDEGKVKIINKKPITASREELILNKRSRSAKLRIVEKI